MAYTTADCRTLDANQMARAGCLVPGTRGTTAWGDDEVGWIVGPQALRLLYLVGESDSYDYEILLSRGPGGRVAFLCPGCNAPAPRLFAPPDATRFLCPKCHRLRVPGTGGTGLPTLDRLDRLIERLKALPEGSPEAARVREKIIVALEELDRQQRELLAAATPAGQVKRPPGRPKTKRPYVRQKPVALTPRRSETEAFCVKCRDRREVEDPRPIVMANGVPAIQGTCSVCGTRVARMVDAK